MSETVRNDVSIESICTVIENTPEKKENNCKKLITNGDCHKGAQLNNNDIHANNNSCSENETSLCSSISEYSLKDNGIGDLSTDVYCDTTANSTDGKQSDVEECGQKKRDKIKKSVSFDPNDEKVRKFISGDPIVDQKNPFKSNTLNNGALINGQNNNKKKKTPPPIPTKRSTLSVRKTVTQQLREREREKEKEKERLKNETNNRKSNLSNGNVTLPSPDDFITTEEVLRQSKYVKTYIKNPDPYFVYDPTILAKLKLEEMRELAEKKPPKKLKLINQAKERLKESKKKTAVNTISASNLPFKKCSKPNYPDLSDIKVKVGTDSDGEFFNPAEVTKNAKKFDERVKKLHIGLEDDLDDIEEPLTKSDSSDEVPAKEQNLNNLNSSEETADGMSTGNEENQPIKGTFTNTIKSKEFQEYLEKKGLTLIPKKIPNGAQTLYTPDGLTKKQTHISFRAPDSIQISFDNMDSPQHQGKKPSVFQRLLSNSIFASRRKTTPKESVPGPRLLNDFNAKCKENGTANNQTSPLKRVVLERQSYHGRSRASNLLSTAEALELKQQMERSRRSYANCGDDISLSISSALTNAEYVDTPECKPMNNGTIPILRKTENQTKPLAKPPRRTLSRDRLNNSQQQHPQQQQQPVQEPLVKPKILSTNAQSRENIAKARELSNEAVMFRRSLERSSMVPKRATQNVTTSEKRQLFGRSASMDRNEILKRSANRQQYNRAISACETLKSPTVSQISKEDEFMAQFNGQNGPKLTSTPVKNSPNKLLVSPKNSPMSNTLSPTKPYNSGMHVDLQEWERLRAFKERTDKELYFKVLQQQQQQQQLLQQHQLQQQHQRVENIYERLPASSSQAIVHAEPQYHTQTTPQNNFLRGSPQRNTFSGTMRGHRNAKIIDGKALLAIEQAQEIQVLPINGNKWGTEQSPTVRCQSALDGVTNNSSNKNMIRRGYESDNETPVILRRRQAGNTDTVSMAESGEQPRRIGGILTREEILQKVKEFCRKSMNKTPTMQAIYEKQPLNTDMSPISYVSVETHQRPMTAGRMYAAPQVPQRMHSLPQRFVPIIQEARVETDHSNPSPIYAHVIKRSSLQSNQSAELYDTPQHHARQITRNTLTRPENHGTPVQYVILDSDQLAPQYQYQHQPQLATAGQDVYIRVPAQSVPSSYGYIAARDAQTIRPRILHDGRSTPLILDRSSQQASQIYWTPQHQRLQQQHTGLMPVQISPRYTSKQPATYAMVPTTTNNSRAVRINPLTQQYYNIPTNTIYSTLNNKQVAVQQVMIQQPSQSMQQQQQQQQQQNYSNYSPQQQNIVQKQQVTAKSLNDCNAQNHYEWESGSEGEVQRIMEQQRKSGELKSSNILANIKMKLARLWPNSPR